MRWVWALIGAALVALALDAEPPEQAALREARDHDLAAQYGWAAPRHSVKSIR